MDILIAILKLYGPIVLSLFLIFISVILKSRKRVRIMPITIFNAIKLSIPITNKPFLRIIIIAASFFPLLLYLTFDYSVFFPSRFTMDVFFDQEGIQKSLAAFSKEELDDLSIPINFHEYQQYYYDDLDKELRKLLPSDNFFTVHNGLVHSEGETSFIVEKILGFQQYHIKESKGRLVHVLERPNAKDVSFMSFFEKVPSNHDYLKPDLSDIYIKRFFILRPMFKQILAEQYRSDGIIFHHTLVGLTKLYFFPIPEFSNTIYLYKHGNYLIPICYAVYR